MSLLLCSVLLYWMGFGGIGRRSCSPYRWWGSSIYSKYQIATWPNLTEPLLWLPPSLQITDDMILPSHREQYSSHYNRMVAGEFSLTNNHTHPVLHGQLQDGNQRSGQDVEALLDGGTIHVMHMVLVLWWREEVTRSLGQRRLGNLRRYSAVFVGWTTLRMLGELVVVSLCLQSYWRHVSTSNGFLLRSLWCLDSSRCMVLEVAASVGRICSCLANQSGGDHICGCRSVWEDYGSDDKMNVSPLLNNDHR